jgi:sugar (pentulose or hexulose) kinase
MKHYIAADLGASNGRTILGRFDGEKLTLEEVGRFENNYVRVHDGCFWDILRLYGGILEGIGRYAKEHAEPLSGIGIDTWGVDFGLVDRQGRIVGNPRAYRDPRGARGMKAFHDRYGERTAFDISGIANLEFNTLYQLYDMAQQDDPQLRAADKLLMMPDLLGYMLCGELSTEYTEATTTQMLDCRTGRWSPQLLEMAGIRESLLTGIQMSGEVKGKLVPAVLQDTGLAQAADVICVGSHDTASAVASVPAKTQNYAYISSGTWSLMGVVSDHAVMGDAVYDNHFSNEGTITGRYRPLRNIMGLWVIQNCKRFWNRLEKLSWNDIESMARAAPAFASFIDVNAHDFFTGEDMPEKIQRYCAATGQPVPQSKGEIARTVYESLAMCYREAFEGLEQLQGGRIDVLHIVGGGAKDTLLNQFSAAAIDREVIAGPYEATAIGNLMMQVKSTGGVKDFTEMREVITRSFTVSHFEPRDAAQWTDAYERYRAVVRRGNARE